jgi:type I restriction enzyme S subunit
MVPMSTNQGCRGLVPGENIDTWFLYYFLKMNVELLESLGTGATFKELSTKALAGIKIPLPPLLEQQRIVAILDEAFAAIAKAKANAEQNLKNAKELFESYLKGIFEAKGDGWEEKQLGEVCDFKGGGTPSTKRKEYWGGEIPWVSPKDMKFRSIYSSEDNITELAVEQSSTSIIPSGSVLIVVRSGILSRIVPLGITIKDVTINQDLKALIPKSILSGEFLLYFLEASMKTLLSQVTRGATVHRLSTDSLKDIQISFPAISKQESIVCQLDRLRAETKKLETIYQNKIADLEELKKSILQKAFAGELKTDKPMAVCE